MHHFINMFLFARWVCKTQGIMEVLSFGITVLGILCPCVLTALLYTLTALPSCIQAQCHSPHVWWFRIL